MFILWTLMNYRPTYNHKDKIESIFRFILHFILSIMTTPIVTDNEIVSRDINDVYKKMIPHIPNTHILHIELLKYIKSLWNKAPEALRCGDVYVEFAEILMTHITQDEVNDPWVKTIQAVFRGEE